jgi:hypothetical protein
MRRLWRCCASITAPSVPSERRLYKSLFKSSTGTRMRDSVYMTTLTTLTATVWTVKSRWPYDVVVVQNCLDEC